jgi:hypothetical protein
MLLDDVELAVMYIISISVFIGHVVCCDDYGHVGR